MPYILIVDDDEDFVLATKRVLDAKGHEVKVELDTTHVVEGLKSRCPDLIILDVMFPENSSAGFELARLIRKSGAAGEDVPILMLTAINAAFPLGFNVKDIDDEWLPVTDFLEKPVDLDVFNARVEGLLRKAGGRCDNYAVQ